MATSQEGGRLIVLFSGSGDPPGRGGRGGRRQGGFGSARPVFRLAARLRRR